MREHGSKVVFGKVPRRAKPAKVVKPPTESGSAPTLDPQGWIPQGRFTDNSINVSYETGVAGDMILVFLHETGAAGDVGNVTTPTGWTQVFYGVYGSGDRIAVLFLAKIATGDETGTMTLSVVGSSSFTATNRIKANGATLSTAGIISLTASGADTNPPAITLTGADNFVGLTGVNWQDLGGSFTHTEGGAPTGYDEVVHQPGGSLDASQHIGQRLIAGTGTEDPTTWGAVSGTSRIVTWTVGIPIDAAGASVAPADHDHVEADITDLDHWTETDHDALDHTGLTGVGGGSVNDLTDATITSVADDEVLAYDSGTAEWINQTAAEAGLATAGHTHASSSGELLMQDGVTAPPVPIETEARDDWLYED